MNSFLVIKLRNVTPAGKKNDKWILQDVLSVLAKHGQNGGITKAFFAGRKKKEGERNVRIFCSGSENALKIYKIFCGITLKKFGRFSFTAVSKGW